MAHATFVMALAKFIVATAWADGKLSNNELNALKDLMFRLPDLSGEEWTELEVYIDAPVSAAERTRLQEELIKSLRSSSDKAVAKNMIEKVVAADGVVSPEEKKVLEEVGKALENADVGLFAQLSKLLGGSVSRRTQAAAAAPNREEDIPHFLQNKILFQMRRHLEANEQKEEFDEGELAKWCLAGGLMARVAWVDKNISTNEKEAITKSLHEKWGLDREAAEMVTEIAASTIAKGLDYFRLSRNFYESTERSERLAFLDCLFSIANACGKTSSKEIEEIRAIAKGLKLDHDEFIEAKLRLPREDRSGL